MTLSFCDLAEHKEPAGTKMKKKRKKKKKKVMCISGKSFICLTHVYCYSPDYDSVYWHVTC